MLFFPEEIGVIGGQLIEHQLQILGVLLGKEVLQKGLEIRIAPGFQGLGQTAGDQLALVAQINAVMLLNKFHQTPEVGVSDAQTVEHHIHADSLPQVCSISRWQSKASMVWPSSREYIPHTSSLELRGGTGSREEVSMSTIFCT